jgi:hypothetical protein
MAFRRGERAIVVVSVPSRYVRPFCRWILYRPYKVPTLYMQGRVGWGSNVHVDIYSHDAVTSQDLLPQVHTCGSVIHVG